MIGIDLRHSEPRSATEFLGGVQLLARLVDKGWATMCGTSGLYVFYECPLDRFFFDAVKATGSDFLAILQEALECNRQRDALALIDVRESLENEPEVSDDTFLTHAAASDLDNAAVSWVFDQLHTPASVVAMINRCVATLPPEYFNDRAAPDAAWSTL